MRCGSFQPDTIMVDFEAGLQKSLASTFPDATVDSCNFHFCQALYRNNGLHGLKIDYDRVIVENGTRKYTPVRIWIRRLMGLPFLYDDNVVYAFEALVDAMPDDVGEQLDSLLIYFKRTWIEGKRTARKIGNAKFPPRTWNALRRSQAQLCRRLPQRIHPNDWLHKYNYLGFPSGSEVAAVDHRWKDDSRNLW